jgi:hypothetical protein
MRFRVRLVPFLGLLTQHDRTVLTRSYSNLIRREVFQNFAQLIATSATI